MAYKGIDVSVWQGNIDFQKVKASGIDFVIIRAGYGNGNKDKWFDENYRKAKAAGLHIGAYWYSAVMHHPPTAQNRKRNPARLFCPANSWIIRCTSTSRRKASSRANVISARISSLRSARRWRIKAITRVLYLALGFEFRCDGFREKTLHALDCAVDAEILVLRQLRNLAVLVQRQGQRHQRERRHGLLLHRFSEHD